MKFGFEHDFDEFDAGEVTERTPLLDNGNVAPTSDPAVAEATTKGRSSKASTIVGNDTQSRSEGSLATVVANSDEHENQINLDQQLIVTDSYEHENQANSDKQQLIVADSNEHEDQTKIDKKFSVVDSREHEDQAKSDKQLLVTDTEEHEDQANTYKKLFIADSDEREDQANTYKQLFVGDSEEHEDQAKPDKPLSFVNSDQHEDQAKTYKPLPIPDSDEHEDRTDPDKPLPVTQILLLCFARVCEPLAFFCIFPFINQMCARNGNLQPADTGFYSGLIESLFSLTQMIVMIVWGRLSDRLGRKPVLVVSLCGVAVFTALFGTAQTILQMIMFRCLAGVFSAAVITIRTMIAEHSTQKTQARAFSWFAFSGNMGIFFGPLIGGALADPAAQYGGPFARSKLFKRYPYALATIVTGLIALIAAAVTAFFVEETLPPNDAKNPSVKDDREAEPLLSSSISKPEPDSSTRSLLKAPGVIPVLYLSSHIAILAFSYTAIVPVFWYEPVHLGGFGFSSLYISLFMGLTGAAQAIWLLLVFPPLQHRIGTGGILRVCAYAYPFFFLICPLLNLLLREGSHGARVTFWVFAPILLSLGVGVSMSFTAIQLAINDVSPSPRMLGTLNGLSLMLSSGIRAFSPAAFTSLFAVGVQKQILWGYLAWAIMIAVAAGLTLAVRWLPPNAEGMVRDDGKKVVVVESHVTVVEETNGHERP